ncbi:uncharacterized protein RSE6_10344 [Rhynchosporium secalis]|uniref:Uncharacterized protein n=1 Tax=Rhynchosporium secalis TaxID=38038 RepID=A0A1E1MK68_RHYSE|nr:uncharacterized protein RSE6_10344 [Rhynchosporium secalis]
MIKDALRTGGGSKGTTESEDFLAFLKKQNQKDGAKMSERDMFSHLSNHLYDVLLAGSDTTLLDKIQAADSAILLSRTVIYAESLKHSSYQFDPPKLNRSLGLRAWSLVVEEALRLHAAVALNLERIVPEVGLSLCGNNNPAGVIVGINAWVLHYDQEVFGPRE